MPLFKNLLKRFEKQCETFDNHPDPSLQTRYYKGNVDQIFQSVEEIFKNDPKTKILNISKEHGEIAVNIHRGLHMFFVITIITVRPFETAVDVNISTETGSLTGAYSQLKSEITHFYEMLNKRHTSISQRKG